MSVSILVVDDEPDVAELFRHTYLGQPRGGHMTRMVAPVRVVSG